MGKENGTNYPLGTMFTPQFDRFFRTHEKVMWDFSGLDFSTIRKDLLTQADVDGLRAAMIVESHNPVYTMRILEYFRHDHEMTSFIVTWSYEEMKHYGVLRTYLEACGMVDNEELADELKVTRAGPWGDVEMGYTNVQAYTYTMIQEQVTGRFYRAFADHTKEPLLQHILRLVSKDEYRHCQYYLDKGKQELEKDRGKLKEVDDVIANFQMPGYTFMANPEKYADYGKEVAPIDVAAMKETVDKIGQMTGKMHLFKLATDRGLHRKLQDEFGLDLKMVLAALR